MLENHSAYLRQHCAASALVSRLQKINQVLSTGLGLGFAPNAPSRGSYCG